MAIHSLRRCFAHSDIKQRGKAGRSMRTTSGMRFCAIMMSVFCSLGNVACSDNGDGTAEKPTSEVCDEISTRSQTI